MTHKPWALVRVISAHVCIHTALTGMRMAAPLLALRQGHSPFQVGVLLALFSITQVFLAIPAGRFADRNGLQRPIKLAVVFACTGAALAVLIPAFFSLCIAALCLGGATGVATITLQRHVGRMASDAVSLKQAFSWLALGPAFSNFLGPVITGLLIDHAGVWLGGQVGDTNGFRVAFLAMALLPLLSLWWIKNTAESPPVPPPAGSMRSQVLGLLREPRMRQLLLVNWLLSSCWDVHTFVVPVLGHERALSASVIGLLLGAFSVASFCVRLLMPLFAADVREWKSLTVSMIVTALMFALYPAMHSPWAMGCCSVVLGLALGAVQPMIMSTLHQITPHDQHGQALGLRAMTINLSSACMPLLFGATGTVLGVSVLFWVVGAAVATGAPTAWRLRA